MKLKNYFLILIFFAVLILPALDNIFHFSPVRDLFEKRQPTPKPEFVLSKEYPKKFEEYYNDNYGFRKTLIHLYSKIMDNIFNESPSNRAVIGKEGWLYFNNENSLIDVEGRLKYDEKILENGIDTLIENWKNLQKENVGYALIIAADKTSIYPEFLPDYIKPNSPTRLDQFLAKLKEKAPDFPVLDLRESMIKAKDKISREFLEEKLVYFKTDTHWTRVGAYYGYLEIMDFLSKKYPNLNLNPKAKEDFIIQNNGIRVGDISGIMNLKNHDIDYEMIPKTPFQYYEIKIDEKIIRQFHKPDFFVNKNQNLPVLFSYKDSFMDGLDYFLSEHFSRSYYVNEFPCDINMKIVKQYRPNILIHEMWEGRIEGVLKSCKSSS